MLKTTTVKVRVTTPTGELVVGAAVQARLQNFGIDHIEGLLDRSRINATTGIDGIATLHLWPNMEGTTDVQYRITARNADGSKLVDEQVSVPETDSVVWFHDILMLPPPSAKPYDEAAIEIIIQNRVESAASAAAAKVSETNAKESETNAKSSELISVGIAEDMEALYGDANDIHQAADESKAAAAAALVSETNAKESEVNAAESEVNAKASEVASGLSETNSKASEVATIAAAQEILSLYDDVAGIHADAIASAASAAEASQSEVNAKASELNAKDSEDAALAASLAAKDSEVKAKASETAAGLSETAAAGSATDAEASADAAAVSAAAALVSEQNAKASELATKDIYDQVGEESAGVIDAISAATAAANAANAAAGVANSGAIAAYNAADEATAALIANQAALDTATARSIAASNDAASAQTTANDAHGVADAATTQAAQARADVQVMQGKIDALPTDFASPEEVADMKLDVADLKATVQEANLTDLTFSTFGKSVVAGANAAAVVDLLELGTAALADIQSGAYDVALQKLMATGAFGLGGYLGTYGAMDSAMTGFYTVSATDAPASGTHDYHVINLAGTDSVTQLWFSTGANVKLYARHGARVSDSTSWSTFVPMSGGGGSSADIEVLETAVAALESAMTSVTNTANNAATDIQALKTSVGTVNVVALKATADATKVTADEAAADIAEMRDSGGLSQDVRVNDITPFGWSVAKAVDADAAKVLLEIAEQTGEFALKADFDQVAIRVGATENAVSNAQTSATNAGTAAANAQASADDAQATADATAALFADSNVNALRTQVNSLDTNVDTLTIRVNHLDGDGAIDVADLDAKVDSITELGWSIVQALTAGDIKTALALGTAASAAVQTSATDKTAGALLKVGAFGLGGGAIPVTDLGSLTLENGIYSISNVTATTPAKLPMGATAAEYVVLHMGRTNNIFVQVAITVSLATPKLFFRKVSGISAGDASDWIEPGSAGNSELAQMQADIISAATLAGTAKTKAETAQAGVDGLVTALANTNSEVSSVNTKAENAQATASEAYDKAVALEAGGGGGGSGGGLSLGDVIAKVSGSYTDFIECNGAYLPNSDAPALASLINAVAPMTYTGYLASSVPRKTLGAGEIYDAQYHKGYLFVLSSLANQLTVYDSSYTLVYSYAFNVGHKHLTVSDNAVYIANSNRDVYVISVAAGVFKNNYAGFATQSSNGGMSVVSISATEDYIATVSIRRIINPVTNANRFAGDQFITSYGNFVTDDCGSSVVKTEDGRFFGSTTINGNTATSGIYELFFNVSGALTSYKLICLSPTVFDVIRVAGKNIYFGGAGIQYRYNVESKTLYDIKAPAFYYQSAVKTFTACYKNVIYINGLSQTAANFGAISFDYGETFTYLPTFNTKMNTVAINSVNNTLLFLGDIGTVGSADASSGNTEIHQLTLVDGAHFKAPRLTGAPDGYRYYVKK
jgi:hypothetical protein